MKISAKTILLILLIPSAIFGQEEPPLPPIAKSNNQSTDKFEIINQSQYEEPKNNEVCQISHFNIKAVEFTDNQSKYYHEKIKEKLINVDSNISEEEIISYTKYRNSLDINPLDIDSLAVMIYKQNENKNYNEAIKLCEKLYKISPNNLTLHKELAYAYKNIGNVELAEKHFKMMQKIVEAIQKYSDGCRENPFILNNHFEGFSLYEALSICFPKKSRIIQTKDKKIIGGYDCYHIMKFSDLNHYKKYLKPDTYKIE